ncbi:MAG: phospho-sugar mutase [Clostridiales bacterium]|nr:phospho-sugar mutase [Clostridiales bacterium]
MNAFERYNLWLSSADISDAAKFELRDIKDSSAEIIERFYTELDFGTAGLRGVLGMGDNRMNIYTVRKATEGLARYLTALPEPEIKSVCIAYDSRRNSDLFARETACVLAAHGIQVYLYSTLHSVPQLSFAVTHLHCTAGVVITASHNPPKYKGYKVYWGHGGQVGPTEAAAITAEIRKLEGFATKYMPYQEGLNSGRITLIGREVDEVYYAYTLSLLQNPAKARANGALLTLVYTPLHGSGYVPVTNILRRMGIQNVHVVEQQRLPNPDFPTVSAPNPEDPKAFTLAFKLAEKVGASVILATDPDADRLGVCVKTKEGKWVPLTGNQIGCILIHSLLTAKQAAGTLPADGLVVKSLVSTCLADAICAKFNVECREVLTGFRFIAEQMDICEREGTPQFLFGFEESYGFLTGTRVHDKDAVCAAMLIAETCAALAGEGRTLYDLLEEIYQTYGYYIESVKSYTLEGKAGIEKIRAAMRALRKAPPCAFGDFTVAQTRDYTDSGATGLPPSDVLRYAIQGGATLIVRPSGTEPKLKVYVGASADTEAGAKQNADALIAAADGVLRGLLFGRQ